MYSRIFRMLEERKRPLKGLQGFHFDFDFLNSNRSRICMFFDHTMGLMSLCALYCIAHNPMNMPMFLHFQINYSFHPFRPGSRITLMLPKILQRYKQRHFGIKGRSWGLRFPRKLSFPQQNQRKGRRIVNLRWF